MRYIISATFLLLATGTVLAAESSQRALTFEDRVIAQERIDAVYKAALAGPAVDPIAARASAEAKVRDTLKKSALLTTRWNNPITSEALHRELERIARNTANPDRLRALYAALDNDPLLIEETLARPVLVDRLIGNFTDHDQNRWKTTSATIDADAVRREAARPLTEVSAAPAPMPKAHGCDPGGVWDNGLLGRLPAPRSGHSAVWTGAEMIVWGGYTGMSSTNSGGGYDPILDTWRTISVAGAPSPRTSHQAVWTGHEMIVWGGANQLRGSGSPPLLNDGGRYNPSSDTWTPISEIGAPSSSGYHDTSVWTGTELIVWNGTGGGRYNPSNDSWHPVSAVGAPSGGTAVWTGTKMIVWGVAGGAQYDPANDTWTPMSAVGAPTQTTPPLLWTGNEVIAWDWKHSGVGALYNPATNSWRAMSPGFVTEGPPVWTGSEMLFSGGSFDPSTNTWKSLPWGFFRNVASAVWSGRYLISWGGVNEGSGTVNTGSRYDSAGVGTGTSTNNAPSGDVALGTPIGMLFWSGVLYDVTLDAWKTFDAPLSGEAVSTGREVLWWNGSSGGRLDLATLNWTPISTIGAPSAGAAVWTGSLMVVWTGSSGGGRYNPANDTWTPLASSGAPSIGGRAVWAGSVMTVWNGSSRTGARYDPVTNTWTPMSSTGAPSARTGFAIVGTGNSMVIWGGLMGLTKTNDGGRYYPATDTWLPTSPVNAPSPRRDFASVWTGREMVVWGGYIGGDADATTNTGGLYDPVSDVWVSVTQDGAPVERYGHTLVWTGDAVLVWGGIVDYYNEFSPLNTGGRLFLGQLYDDDGDGSSECQGDCDDSNPLIHPGAAEVCNGIDDNCDGRVDEGGDALCDDHAVCTEDICQGTAGCVHRKVDLDGDGVCNAQDQCPATIVTPTVVIDSCNTGVRNYLFPDGCNFGDAIAQCRASAGNHGQFVSCVAHRVDTWKGAGLVTGPQGSRIVRCAAN